jgi:hypothetical protein
VELFSQPEALRKSVIPTKKRNRRTYDTKLGWVWLSDLVTTVVSVVHLSTDHDAASLHPSASGDCKNRQIQQGTASLDFRMDATRAMEDSGKGGS